jgi:hypothetical protein
METKKQNLASFVSACFGSFQSLQSGKRGSFLARLPVICLSQPSFAVSRRHTEGEDRTAFQPNAIHRNSFFSSIAPSRKHLASPLLLTSPGNTRHLVLSNNAGEPFFATLGSMARHAASKEKRRKQS